MERIPKLTTLSDLQENALWRIANQCVHAGCEGGCNLGWYEPVEGPTLRSARALERKGLVSTANGSVSGWIAAHVTERGRKVAASLPHDKLIAAEWRQVGYFWSPSWHNNHWTTKEAVRIQAQVEVPGHISDCPSCGWPIGEVLITSDQGKGDQHYVRCFKCDRKRLTHAVHP